LQHSCSAHTHALYPLLQPFWDPRNGIDPVHFDNNRPSSRGLHGLLIAVCEKLAAPQRRVHHRPIRQRRDVVHQKQVTRFRRIPPETGRVLHHRRLRGARGRRKRDRERHGECQRGTRQCGSSSQADGVVARSVRVGGTGGSGRANGTRRGGGATTAHGARRDRADGEGAHTGGHVAGGRDENWRRLKGVLFFTVKKLGRYRSVPLAAPRSS